MKPLGQQNSEVGCAHEHVDVGVWNSMSNPIEIDYSKTSILEYFYCRQEFLVHKSPRLWNIFLRIFGQKEKKYF